MDFPSEAYDKWKTTPPERKIYGFCDWCGNEMYYGDEIRETTNGVIHTTCFDDMAWETLHVRTFIAGEE